MPRGLIHDLTSVSRVYFRPGKRSQDRKLRMPEAGLEPTRLIKDMGIQVHGILHGNGITMWDKPDGALDMQLSSFPLPDLPQRKRIFKYPSWRYPGQYEDETAQ